MLSKVYVEENQDYDLIVIKAFIKKVIDDILLTDKLFYDGQKVFLKLNLLTDRKPEQVTTTNPVFVQGIIQVLKKIGCVISLGDSPAGKMNQERLEHIYEVTGFKRLAEVEQVELNYDCSSVRINNIFQVKAMHDVDIVVNVCKMKTHVYTTFTGAVKNCYGSIPGEIKHQQHALHPTTRSFCDYLIKVAQTLNPAISFMDGIMAMQGNGPSNGKAYAARLMLASLNPYALDHIAIRLLQIPEKLVLTDILARRKKLYDEAELVSSKSMKELLRYDFKLADNTNLAKLMRRIPFPEFDQDICIGCQACYNNCPQHTIVMLNNKAVLKPENCIKCYCCQEICPVNAIKVI